MNDEFTLNELGIISNPGKFEGEHLSTPYFWNLGLEGWADNDDGTTYSFHLTNSDREKFPELVDVNRLELSETESGFVYSHWEVK